MIILFIIFAYLVIGTIVENIIMNDDDVMVIIFWPFVLFLWLAVNTGDAIWGFFDEKKWKEGDKE